MKESFKQKVMWLHRIKSMILSYQKEIDKLNERKREIFIEHLYAFTNIPPRFKECQCLGEESDEIVDELEYAINEKKKWIELYFRDLSNL